jgi:hypothetical protein
MSTRASTAPGDAALPELAVCDQGGEVVLLRTEVGALRKSDVNLASSPHPIPSCCADMQGNRRGLKDMPSPPPTFSGGGAGGAHAV